MLSVARASLMLHKRNYHAMSQLGNRYIYVSGSAEPKYSKTVEVFDIVTQRWKEVAHMHTARSYHASCSIADTVYVFCGRNQIGSLSSIEKKLHGTTEGWQILTVTGLPVMYGMRAEQIN